MYKIYIILEKDLFFRLFISFIRIFRVSVLFATIDTIEKWSKKNFIDFRIITKHFQYSITTR